MYSRFQKFVSALIIFSIMFSIIFRVPFLNFDAFAQDYEYYDLVSIIVDEDTYSKIDSELKRYAEDIQSVLENTRAVIVPVDSGASSFDIVSVNETLFNEGYKSLENVSFESRLVGTVLVGDLPVPIANDGLISEKTILPYTDFGEKSFIFDADSGEFKKNENNTSGITSDIWHGVISPNTGNFDDNIDSLKDYFDKNYDFYEGTGNFETSNGIINGKIGDNTPDDYSPFVFYFDNIRDNASLNYNKYSGYKAYLENKEDIAYNRYTKELSERITGETEKSQYEEIDNLLEKIGAGYTSKDFGGQIDQSNSPDIQTRHITNNVARNFVEVFSAGAISDYRKNIHNGGRYNDAKSVNTDFIQYLVTVLDTVNDQIIIDANNDLEKFIDDLVKNNLSRNIPVATKINRRFYNSGSTCGNDTYLNFLYGNSDSNINSAIDCSIYRGSTESTGKLVEANRGLNTSLVQSDIEVCNRGETSGYWGGNSPLNLDTSKIPKLKLKNSDLDGAIVPLYDISGSIEIKDSTKTPSPLNCLNNNFLLAESETSRRSGCYTDYRIPVIGDPVNWSCSTENTKYSLDRSFDSLYSNFRCSELRLNGDSIKRDSDIGRSVSRGFGSREYICDVGTTYDFKTIPSYLEHKAPNAEYLSSQINSQIPESLPVDKNRYIDFISAAGNYEKIEYPQLFRVSSLSDDFELEDIEENIKNYLDQKTSELNNVINKSNPESLSGVDKEIYDNYLKISEFNDSEIDLYDFFKSKAESEISDGNDEKEINYFDTLKFSIFWNNLNSVSAKYKFVFENYLNDQFQDELSKYNLPKSKKQYEIAYIGAEGDAENMYIKLDPEEKSDNPYSEVIAENERLRSSLYSSRIGSSDYSNTEEGVFKCAPPEGVPIWEWIPAVTCWLQNLLPPTIGINEGSCGVSLFTAEELEEINSCSGDVNKNGINDCIENKLTDGNLELVTDSNKYYYQKPVSLIATIKDKNGKDVVLDNSSEISFEVTRIDSFIDDSKDFSENNSETKYDSSDSDKNDSNILSSYISFEPLSVRASGGKAKYYLSTKNTDSDVYLRATIKHFDKDDNESIFLESEDIKVEIRGDRLFAGNYILSQNDLEIGSSVTASEDANIYFTKGSKSDIDSISNLISSDSQSNQKLVINLSRLSKSGNEVDLEFPISVTLSSPEENKELVLDNLDIFKRGFQVNKAGNYTIDIVDNLGQKISKNIVVKSDAPATIKTDLGTNILQTNGVISANLIGVYDRFGNIVSGENYSVDLSIDGRGLLFEQNNSKNISFDIFEGFKPFRIISTGNEDDNILEISIRGSEGELILSSTENIRTKSDINLSIIPKSGQVKVGGGEYTYSVLLKDTNGNTLTDFNSRVYLGINSVFGVVNDPYVNFVNGVAEVSFNTGITASKSVNLEFKVEGLREIFNKTITIFPDSPMQIVPSLSKNRLKADVSETSIIKLELKDRYGNTTFNDNSTVVDLEILDKYKSIVGSSDSGKTVSEGKGEFEVSATKNPGTAYLKISTNPPLSNNLFEISDESSELEIRGVSENIVKLETFYFWNKDSLKDNNYNSLYTTLLGSNYGDFTKENYLAGELLFEKDNRSLSVTSTLNNSYNNGNILEINNNGGLELVYDGSDLTQDIEITSEIIDDEIYLNVFNRALNIFVGKIKYNFGNDTELKVCDSEICELDDEETSIYLKDLNSEYEASINRGSLIIKDRLDREVFRINRDGKLNRYFSTDLKYSKNNNGKIEFQISNLDENIGRIGFNFVDSKINFSSDESIYQNKVNNLKNSILILITDSSYSFDSIYSESGDGASINYLDPFGSSKSLNSLSARYPDGYENFSNKEGLGWKGGNKTLLSFSAGESVGESLKPYMSFSSVNLGDPVISLKKLKENLPKSTLKRNFDSTTGKLISKKEGIKSYEVFDYNDDDKDDILVITDDNYFSLLENVDTNSEFLDKGNLAHIIDLGSEDLVKTGDFSNDGYDDIVFVDNDGVLNILNNSLKNFTRIELSSQIGLNSRVIRLEVFDMDNDGSDDLVTLSEGGLIDIFYSVIGSEVPVFTRNNLADDYGINLDSSTRSDGGVVYHSLLTQLAETGDLSEQLERNRDGDGDINTDLLDRLIFVGLEYSPDGSEELSDGERISGNINNPNSPELGSSISDSIDAISSFVDSNPVSDNLPSYSKKPTTFIKSEYSELTGIKVSKSYTDTNSGFLVSSDIVDVNVVLENVGTRTIRDIAYLEEVSKYFIFDRSSLEVNGNINPDTPLPGYDFMIQGFDLAPGNKVTINYKAKVRALKYGYLQVGLFEDGELGNDDFGDVIVKQSNKNCGTNNEIYRSTGDREYLKGIKEASCDADKSTLPEDVAKNTIDNNNNGVPDYIDRLASGEDDRQEYAEESLANLYLDFDNDGIPDFEDLIPKSSGSLLENLSDMNNQVDQVSEGVDNFIESFNCGYGGGGCIATPLNWAPLAPGNDPTLFGSPVGDGLNVDEGLPIFSALTGLPTPVGCIPAVWPITPLTAGTCSGLGAGGYLGADSPGNFLRVFVTPTLTGGVGIAVCFGGPASIVGNSIPEGVGPLVPGGNCIVAAKPLDSCSGDGSDGDPESQGYSAISSHISGYTIINGNCSQSRNTKPSYLGLDLVEEHLNYKNTGNKSSDFKNKVDIEFTKLSDGKGTNLGNGSLISIDGDASSNGQFELGIDFSSEDNGNFEDVVKIKQKRISPFPSFLMDWVTRQSEEFITKLTDLPTINIILPDASGLFESGVVDSENKGFYKEQISDSSINAGFELISKTPVLSFNQEIINLSVPVPNKEDLQIALEDWKKGLIDGRRELEEFKNNWLFGTSCTGTAEQIRQCEERERVALKAVDDTERLLSSYERNIEIIDGYSELPDKLQSLVNKKQEYLEQALCNIEAYAAIYPDWIEKNGKRFKTWVELYIMIKSTLKTWQLFIDVFFDYEAECAECKNERHDLVNYEFKVIDAVLPKFPVIQFPKWPDITLDLHNIRAGMDVSIPEFNFDFRPIIFPSPPKISLPDSPDLAGNVKISLPELVTLPTFEIPELPDLPTLPTVSLPDLPPAPKLPKIFSSIEGVLNILKLVTKALCIMRSLPFVPEWRAGDQIAFLTERDGHLTSDFIDVSLPQFSFPFVDAIEVTSYVNLELETDFITEMARQASIPLNSISNNFESIIGVDKQIGDIDIEGNFENVEIDAEINATDDGFEIDSSLEGNNGLIKNLAYKVAKAITESVIGMNSQKDEYVTASEYRELISQSLSSDIFTKDNRLEDIRNVWKQADSYTYSKENKLINELKKTSEKKFEVFMDSLNSEIIETNELYKNIDKVFDKPVFFQVSKETSSNSALEYNKSLKPFNDEYLEIAKEIFQNPGNKEYEEIKGLSEEFKSKLSSGLSRYNDLSAVNDLGLTNSSPGPSCSAGVNSSSEYRYNYEGLYVGENGKNYRLFSYLDELDGDEKTKIIDYDNDSDFDLAYLANGQLYIKQNLKEEDSKNYVSSSPLVTNASKVFDDNFLFAVNNFKESGSSSTQISVSFDDSSPEVNNYRLEYFDIIDKSINQENSSYTPINVRKNIVDSFASIDSNTIISETDNYTLSQNLGYIDSFGNSLNNVSLNVYEYKNIAEDLSNDRAVNLSKGTVLYAGANSFTIRYNINGERKIANIGKYRNIKLKDQITITGLNGQAFIKTNSKKTLTGEDIRNHRGLPILPGDYIDSEYVGEQISFVTINYYDGTESGVDLEKIGKFEIYDLGNKASDYSIILSRENDYYYSKISSFKENTFGISSSQVLISPQIASDDSAPELSFSEKISIPVYQTKEIDLTSSVYDDSGIRNISDLLVDFDLSVDLDGDGNPKNDTYSGSLIKLNKSASSISLDFGPFDQLFDKKIGITLVDKNGNKSFKQVDFEVYSPDVSINFLGNGLIGGQIGEELSDEPVSLFRYRGGSIAKLQDLEGNEKISTDSKGDYSFQVSGTGTDLILSKGVLEIAKIDEKTGKISDLINGYNIKILESNSPLNNSTFPKILIRDETGTDVYYQYLNLSNNSDIKIVEDYDSVDSNGIYARFLNKQRYNYFITPTDLEFNPGVMSIYRSSNTLKESLFTVYPNGKIETANDRYDLEYDDSRDNIVITLIDRNFNIEVAKLLFKVDGDYVIR